jgi:hypothetical protein
VTKQIGITSEDLINQITRAQKIIMNLKLIEDKLDKPRNYPVFNSTITNEIEKELNQTDVMMINNLLEDVKNKTAMGLIGLEEVQHQLIKQLDLILFSNIEKTRNIYTKIRKFHDLMTINVQRKEKCEIDLKKAIEENLELKEALAELEIKIRLSNNNSKKRI